MDKDYYEEAYKNWSLNCKCGCDHCNSFAIVLAKRKLEGTWTRTADGLPPKPWLKPYGHVPCWVFIKNRGQVHGYVSMLSWNCEHECWDDMDEDDHSGYSCESITHWMPMNIPNPPEI